MSNNTPAVPEIWYPVQRVIRTIVQALIVLIPVVNGVALAVVSYLQEQTDVTVDPIVFAWLQGVIAVTAVIMGLVARVMAVPGVNAFLARLGAGSVPKAVVDTEGV